MKENNELKILGEIVLSPKELVSKMNNQEKSLWYFILDKKMDEITKEIRTQLLSGVTDQIEFDFNGEKKILKISRGTTTQKEVTSKKIDFDKAVKFATENGFEIPQIVTKNIDYYAIENSDWFQERLEEFVVETITTKTTRSNDTIRISDVK